MSEKNSAFVCLITGPSGSGKSSVSNALAKKFQRSVVIEVDTLRKMIKNGFVKPYPHTEEVDLQLSLIAKNACDIASNFLEKNYYVFIDGIVGKKLFNQYSYFFKDKKFKTFLILPSLEALLMRFDNRGNDNELRVRTIDLHKSFSEKRDQLDWQVINSSAQSLEETVEQIYQHIKST